MFGRAFEVKDNKTDEMVEGPDVQNYVAALDIMADKCHAERGMHVLHVAASPGALPCQEAEYGRVLHAVEELLEEGSGGCICKRCNW